MRSTIVILIGLLALPMMAQAAPITSGTSSYVTLRDCVSDGFTVCDYVSATVAADAGGLPGASSAAASVSDPAYGSTTGTAQLDGIGAATLTGNVTSLPATRNSSNSYALQRYTHTGPAPMILTFEGTLSYDQTVPLENATFDPLSPGSASGAFAGLDIFTLSDPFLEAGITEFDNFVALNGVSLTPGYVSLASIVADSPVNASASGEVTVSLSVAMNPFDSVWLYSYMQTPAANGAMVDATFVTSSNVPAPAGVLLLLLGLAGIGSGHLRKH